MRPSRPTMCLLVFLAVPGLGGCFVSASEIKDLQDADGDGVPIESDCDDSSASVGAPIAWYVDSDGDGYGAGDPTRGCPDERPDSNTTDNADDCNDANSAVFPGATELCNDLDDDCDGDLDEDGTDAWYADTDGDGHGAGPVVYACDPGPGFVALGDDCDDDNDTVFPGSVEVCGGADDDCDELIDDEDDDLDLTTASTWFDDLDGDGFGDPTAESLACAPTERQTDNNTDCDDTNSAIHPDSAEVCNGEDDDCDELIDDDDPSVDGSTARPWYADNDSDGYGTSALWVVSCSAPPNTVINDDDCDDSKAAVNPDALEVCNTIDDDCDGEVDDDDPSLDLSSATTWYIDEDGDGLGVSDISTIRCDAPSGYADNADDCDDTSTSDLDMDGLQDCEDDDVDGDGLRGTWDIDDTDSSLARGPQAGFGGDGSWTPRSALEFTGDRANLTASPSAGDTAVAVDDNAPFAVGDEILLIDLQGASAGQRAFHYVGAVSGSTSLTLEPPLAETWDASDVVVLQRVPHHTTVTLAQDLSVEPWDGDGGGVLVFRATGAISIAGSIDVSGSGYLGGTGVAGSSSTPTSGGTWSEGPASATSFATAVDGGGGAAEATTDYAFCGGGGAYASDGGGGEYLNRYIPTTNTLSGGASYGDSTLTEWFFGSGGGAGGPDDEPDGISTDNVTGDGGAGGGLVALYSGVEIIVSGSILADGSDGENATHLADAEGELGGGGGGAGGQVLLVADTLTLSGTVQALGGAGGYWAVTTTSRLGYGGDGSDGRIRLEYNTLTGASACSPTASEGSWVE